MINDLNWIRTARGDIPGVGPSYKQHDFMKRAGYQRLPEFQERYPGVPYYGPEHDNMRNYEWELVERLEGRKQW